MKQKAKKEKIKAARAKIKTHVKSKGEKGDFEITESFCYYWWHRLNDAVFDGKLSPPVRFELKAFRYDLGWCIPWRPYSKQPKVVIAINTDIIDRKMFLCVLAHEMVHQWEWEVENEWFTDDGHGEKFFSWRHRLKHRVGLPLDESY